MQWIKADDRIPYDGAKVIVKSKGGKIVEGVRFYLCKNNSPHWSFSLESRCFKPIEWCYAPDDPEYGSM